MTTHEHDPRAVEALGVEVFDAMYPGAEWTNAGKADHCLVAPVVRVILTREAALKERGDADAKRLVAALEDAECELSSIARIHRARPEQVALAKIRDALRAHRASRQPSEPTLEQAVDAMLEDRHFGNEESFVGVRVEHFNALKAARERGKAAKP